jgi:hypothetical protein
VRRTGSIGWVLLPLWLGGCATIDVPEGYVKLRHPQPYDLKAVSARGNVIALTVRSNEDQSADLQFWSEAVEYQKLDLDGMELAGRESIRSRSDLEGVLFHFESGQGQGKYAYLVALYVTSTRIYTIEAAGPAELIAADMEKLRRSMLSLR